MNQLLLVRQPVVTEIGLQVVAHAPDLSRTQAIREWQRLGNPLLDADADGTLHAVAQVERPAAEGQLVWVCDFCSKYAESRAEVEAHEQNCENR